MTQGTQQAFHFQFLSLRTLKIALNPYKRKDCVIPTYDKCPGLHAATARAFAKNHENRNVNDFSKASCKKSQIKRFFVLLAIFAVLCQQIFQKS